MNVQRNICWPLGLFLVGLVFWGCMDQVYVDAGTAGPGLGSAEAPFPKIATGLFWASSGATVHVASGDYPENLVISRPVKLVGAGAGSTRLLADVTRKGIEIGADDVEVRGFSIIGMGEPDPENMFLGGVYAEDVNRLTVSENTVGPYSSMGIGVGRASNVTIENNQVLDISGLREQENYGIIVAIVPTAVVRGNRITNVDGEGLLFAESGGQLENNTVYNCPLGSWISRSNLAGAEVSFRGNTVQGSSHGAVTINLSTVSAMYDNSITDNPGFGMEIYDDETSILACGNNTLLGNHPDFGEYLQYFGYLDLLLACLD
jgi:nitrous oxidase accessory protein NosD